MFCKMRQFVCYWDPKDFVGGDTSYCEAIQDGMDARCVKWMSHTDGILFTLLGFLQLLVEIMSGVSIIAILMLFSCIIVLRKCFGKYCF